MNWIQKQDKITEKIDEALDELAEELNISVPHYPEVYWIGGSLDFEYLGIPEFFREDFENIRKNKSSVCFINPKMILIGYDHPYHIAEEAAHFLNYTNSRLRASKRRLADWLSIGIIVEMLGFFGSKILCPERKNPFNKNKDWLPLNMGSSGVIREISYTFNKLDDEERDLIMNQQGYMLGEKLFCAYVTGKISKKEIKDFFINPFIYDGEATATFLRLKYNF